MTNASSLTARNLLFPVALLVSLGLHGCGHDHTDHRENFAGPAENAESVAATIDDAGLDTTWFVTRNLESIDIKMRPIGGPPSIGRFIQWEIHLQDKMGRPVFPAKITVGGGMPGHTHGMPTKPQVTRYLENGIYLLEGTKFSMAGDWEFQIVIETPHETVRTNLPFAVDY